MHSKISSYEGKGKECHGQDVRCIIRVAVRELSLSYHSMIRKPPYVVYSQSM